MKLKYLLYILSVFIIFLSCEDLLETGTIMGNVSNGGSPVGGAYVLLLNSGDLLQIEQPLENGSITNGNGDYIIILVEPNRYYYVVAVKDNNGDLKYTPGVDAFGYYGSYLGFTWIPTEITVGSGETLHDIDITEMYVL